MNNTEIEQHLAWQGARYLREVEFILINEKPFTYILTQSPGGDGYHLSYITGKDQKIIHIPFRRVINPLKQGYRNCSNTIFSTVENLIRYKLKGKGSPFKQLPLKLSA